MGNARHVAARLEAAIRQAPPARLVDLGAGDGYFLLRCVRRLPGLGRGLEIVMVDREPAIDEAVLAELRARGLVPRLVRADALDWLAALPDQPGTGVLANLFLHHFTSAQLATALAGIARKADWCCACEPRRNRGALAATRALWLIGANAVTRHDAPVSVRAGFRDGELSTLWPPGPGWRLDERPAGLFSHVFLAQRS
jgi:hypothetical protein